MIKPKILRKRFVIECKKKYRRKNQRKKKSTVVLYRYQVELAMSTLLFIRVIAALVTI